MRLAAVAQATRFRIQPLVCLPMMVLSLTMRSMKTKMKGRRTPLVVWE